VEISREISVLSAHVIHWFDEVHLGEILTFVVLKDISTWFLTYFRVYILTEVNIYVKLILAGNF